MLLDGKTLKGLFEHEILKPSNIRTSQENIQNLMEYKLCIEGLKFKGTL